MTQSAGKKNPFDTSPKNQNQEFLKRMSIDINAESLRESNRRLKMPVDLPRVFLLLSRPTLQLQLPHGTHCQDGQQEIRTTCHSNTTSLTGRPGIISANEFCWPTCVKNVHEALRCPHWR